MQPWQPQGNNDALCAAIEALLCQWKQTGMMARVTVEPSVARPAWDVNALREMVLLDAHCRAIWEDGRNRALKPNDALSHDVRAGVNKVFGVEQVPAKAVSSRRERLGHLHSCTSSEAKVWTDLHVSDELRALWRERAAASRPPPADAKPGRRSAKHTRARLLESEDQQQVVAAPGNGSAMPYSEEAPLQRLPPSRRGWTTQEDGTIVELARLHGAKWRKIARSLPGRSDSAIRNRWQRLQAHNAHEGRGGREVAPRAIADLPGEVATSTAACSSTSPALTADDELESGHESAVSADELEAAVSADAMRDVESWLQEADSLPALPALPSQALLLPLPPVSPPAAISPPLSPPSSCDGSGMAVPDYSIGWRSLEFRCAKTRGRFHQSTAAPAIELVMRHLVVRLVIPLQLLMSCKVSQEKFGVAFLLQPSYYATLPHEWLSSLCSLLLLVCWRRRARLNIGLGVFSSVVYLGAVLSLVLHQAILLHRCPDDPRSMSCSLSVKAYLHDPDFQDAVHWFQALLLLTALFATGLHVPYHLIVTAQLSALLLSMHIFVHSSRFEAHDFGHTPAESSFSPAFDANASSQSPFDKPSTSSSTRVTLYQLIPMGLSLALAAFFKRAQLKGFVELDKVTRQLRAAQATPTTRVWASRRRSRLFAAGTGTGPGPGTDR